METEVYVDMSAGSGDFITISRLYGLEIGKNDKARINLQIKCKNATTPQEVAVQFDMDLQTVLNLTIDPSWKVNLNIPSILVQNVAITKDHVGMVSRRYDRLLTTVFKTFINNINIQWLKPFDITSLDPKTLGFIKNMFTGLTLSPYILEEFYYLGFNYFTDPVPTGAPMYSMLNERAAEQYGP